MKHQKISLNFGKKVDKVDSKVTKMIITVVVAFTILVGSWMFIRSASDYDHSKGRPNIEQYK